MDLRDALQSSLGNGYTVGGELGGGSMSRVFVAEDGRLRRRVVVKVLSPELVEGVSAQRFEREIALAASLQQANIVPVLSVGDADGLPFYTMPFVEGESLRSRLARGDRMPVAEVARVLADVARALAYAHGCGVVHRDIKPDNVLLSGRTAVVTDFGIAKALEAARPAGGFSTLTAIGTSVGTPAYMSPEQAAGDPDVDHRADFYALGCMAYELLAGHPPFHDRSPQRVLAAHVNEAPLAIDALRPELPPPLADLVMRCLAKSPADRPQDAEAILRVLEDLPPSTPATLRIEPNRGLRRGIVTVAAALIVVVAAVAAGWLRGERDGEAPTEMITAAGNGLRTLAVLPFENTGGAVEDDYFSDGMTDELSHALARLPGVRLAGRTSSYAFKGKAAPAQEIGRALDVGAFVTGTVRRAGDRIRVTAQLVSTADGKVLRDAVSETTTGDVFAIQDQLTRSIVAAIAPALGPDVNAPSRAGVRGTNDREAYDLYLKGRYHYVERGPENLVSSISYFRQAVDRDPSFARAYAGLAMAYTVLGVYLAGTGDTVIALREGSAQRAVALDPTLADAQVVMAAAAEYDERYAEAEERFTRAIQLEPSNVDAHHWYGYFLLSVGRTDDALAHLHRAETLDPLAKSPRSAAGQALVHKRLFAEAEAHARRLLEIDPGFPLALLNLASAQLFGGSPDSALATLNRLRSLNPRSPLPYPTLLLANVAAGRVGEAQRLRGELRSAGSAVNVANAAFADLVLGDPEPMVRLASTREGRRRLLALFGAFGCNPLLDPLWNDRRFRETMTRTGVRPCELVQPWPGSARR